MTDRQIGSLANDIARFSGYRTHAPDDAADIDRLLSEGVSSKEIVDGLSPYRRQPARGSGESRKLLKHVQQKAAASLGGQPSNAVLLDELVRQYLDRRAL